LFYLVWIAIDDNVSEPELLTGVGAVVLATVAASAAGRAATVHGRVQPGMLRYWYRPATLPVLDSARVCGALIKRIVLRQRIEGRFRAVRYRASRADGADVARRVLTEWSASIAPNGYAIGVDTDQQVLLVHELVDVEGPLDPLELG
jgi:hypothetical protein